MGQDDRAAGALSLTIGRQDCHEMGLLRVACPDLGGCEREYVEECLRTGWISSAGPFVRRFETAFAGACGVPFGVATASGTAALHLALLTLGVRPGDEVLVPAWTFVATANAVVHAGAAPVLVDVEPGTWGMDPAAAEAKITRRTRAMIIVHLYGIPADMSGLMAVARRHGLRVIEDAAEAHGAEVAGHRVGSLGHVGCFSLFANKIVTTGEGGILVTRSQRLAEAARRLRDHGTGRRRYWHPVIGYSYGLGNLQAAVGLAQVERFDELLKRKDAIAARYVEGLQGNPGIQLPPSRPGVRSVCWLMAAVIDPRRFGMGRTRLMAALAARGIETRPFFYPLHRLPPYRRKERFPVAERLAARGLNLPSGPRISEAEIDRVVGCIDQIHREAAGTRARK